MENNNAKGSNDEIVSMLYGLFVKNVDKIKNIDDTVSDINVSENFDKLYKANKEDNVDEFITLAKKATKDELSICLETGKNLKIIQCILEDYDVTDGIIDCYKNSILYDYVHVSDYVEEKYTKYILDLMEPGTDSSESYSDIEEEENS